VKALLRQTALPAALVLAALVLAQALRHGLVEPAALTAACDAAPWQDARCTLRTLTIQAFVQQRIGIAALALALLATLTRRRGVALAALLPAAAGLVLYSSALAAPALLLAALVCVRPGAAR
jgi:hypothetical protein